MSVVYSESFATKSEAMRRKNEMKKLNRAEKIKLIDNHVTEVIGRG